MANLALTKTWVNGEIITAADLNTIKTILEAYFNGGVSLEADQIADRYTDFVLQLPLLGFAFTPAAPVIYPLYFTLPATAWDLQILKVGVTAQGIAGAGATTIFDLINVGTGLSVLPGAPPNATVAATEASVSGTPLVALVSGTQYAMLLTLNGDGVRTWSNVHGVIYGKMLLRA